MPATLLTLILLCPLPQGQAKTPDLSSPEKAAKAWAETSLSLKRSLPLREVVRKAEEAVLPALTPAAQVRQKKRAAEQAKSVGGDIGENWTSKITAVEDAAGGGREVSLQITVTPLRGPGPTVGIHRYVFEQVGGKWLLKAAYNPCPSCEGTGVCRTCAKRPPGGPDCYSCSGKKTCQHCKGTKQFKQKLATVGVNLVKRSITVTVKPDYSTPQKAVETYLGLLRRRELTTARRLGTWVRGAYARMRPHLVPALVKQIDANVAQCEVKGTRVFAAFKPKLESLEQEPDSAFAVVTLPTQSLFPFGRAATGRARVVLKRTGETWKVDLLEKPCYVCAGKGHCTACKGKQRPKPCSRCKGNNHCSTCKGAGWRKARTP